MPPAHPWPGVGKIDKPWGVMRLCAVCTAHPSSATLRVNENGFLCGKHDPLPDGPVVCLEDAAKEAWSGLPPEQQHARVTTAIAAVLAVQNGARYFSHEGVDWAWDLWKAAVRIDARGHG